MSREVFICEGVRTPIGRFGGALARLRADDLAAAPIKALMAKLPKADWGKLDEVVVFEQRAGTERIHHQREQRNSDDRDLFDGGVLLDHLLDLG